MRRRDKKLEPQKPGRRRSLLIVAGGITFLILMTAAATIVDAIVPRHPTPAIQTVLAGPYEVTLQVTPNPPRITQPATLAIQVLHKDTQQPITNAHIVFASTMESMGMENDQAEAHWQPDGFYIAQAQFSMSGPWQIHLIVNVPGAQPQNATIEVTAQ